MIKFDKYLNEIRENDGLVHYDNETGPYFADGSLLPRPIFVALLSEGYLTPANDGLFGISQTYVLNEENYVETSGEP